MNPPTENEWSEVIHNLPKHKASGPSQISNEMLQNLSPNMSNCIWKIITACLRLNDIPDAWHISHTQTQGMGMQLNKYSSYNTIGNSTKSSCETLKQ